MYFLTDLGDIQCIVVCCLFCGVTNLASSFSRFLDHTQRRATIGRTPLDEWSIRHRDLYLRTHNTHNRQTSMPPVGFEPTFSAGERLKTYALDRAATGTGMQCIVSPHNEQLRALLQWKSYFTNGRRWKFSRNFYIFHPIWTEFSTGAAHKLLLSDYLLTAWSRVLSEKLTWPQLEMKFPAFYGTRWFITTFTSALHLFLSWARLIQSMPPIPLLEDAFHLYFHLRLGLPSDSFPQVSAPRSCMHLSCLPYVRHAPPISFFLIL